MLFLSNHCLPPLVFQWVVLQVDEIITKKRLNHGSWHGCLKLDFDLSFWRWCEGKGKHRGSDYAVVEDDDQHGSGCRFLCCGGLLARFRNVVT